MPFSYIQMNANEYLLNHNAIKFEMLCLMQLLLYGLGLYEKPGYTNKLKIQGSVCKVAEVLLNINPLICRVLT